MTRNITQKDTSGLRYNLDSLIKKSITHEKKLTDLCTHLASSIGVTYKTIERYRKSVFPDGPQAPYYNLAKMAYYFGVTVDELSNEPIPASMETLEDFTGNTPEVSLEDLNLR